MRGGPFAVLEEWFSWSPKAADESRAAEVRDPTKVPLPGFLGQRSGSVACERSGVFCVTVMYKARKDGG